MPANALPYRPHNHNACVRDALAEAQAICQARNARLTPIRRRVLELVWESHKPLGAYDLLAVLAQEGHNAAPPTVYRALDFLQQQGLVHRIASLNAFVGCAHARENHTGMFLICQQCRNVHELASGPVAEAVNAASSEQGFEPLDTTIEVAGLCPACRAIAPVGGE
ncbi:Fur family transcriptional regulator, zinc uptake regulator [Marinobacter daqiaonensis]|uniref:Ferric uptake regulation protein n=1 Tax=Marinobacter daqiaonensis TaxID=650891 RepID=A0A1I6I8X7_9GAMM|nr:Fur family transcriptional regulator [Marinobacter daqiaonensis]SFR63166.1 Fur family transcriptional regulator, zinc uptake regulator [Marinobacter daqiaonensis]